jgi:hypothetical protein
MTTTRTRALLEVQRWGDWLALLLESKRVDILKGYRSYGEFVLR